MICSAKKTKGCITRMIFWKCNNVTLFRMNTNRDVIKQMHIQER